MSNGNLTVHEDSCHGFSSCFNTMGNTLIYSRSCWDYSSCGRKSGDTTIHEDSCRGRNACESVSGNTLIYSGSCHEPVSIQCTRVIFQSNNYYLHCDGLQSFAHSLLVQMHAMILRSTRIHALAAMPVEMSPETL
jgi:hypothetical protein